MIHDRKDRDFEPDWSPGRLKKGVRTMDGVGMSAAMDRVGLTRASTARIYDYFLGGKDNYDVDRADGFVVQNTGVRQFLDTATGIPTAPNLHQVAQKTDPASRVVYVDNDPV